MAPAYCPSCGTSQTESARFCPSCGLAFEEPATSTPTAAPVGGQPGLAAGLQQIEYMRMKLIAGRLLGLTAGIVLWWFILVPMFAMSQPILTLVALVVCIFGGMYVGTLVTLSVVAGRR